MNGRQLVLVRHGETQWSCTGRHTGRTDVALTELGQRQADALGLMLRGRSFAAVLVSPLQRATETLRRASLDAARVRVLQELVEWDYGDYEGLTTEEIRRSVPDWTRLSMAGTGRQTTRTWGPYQGRKEGAGSLCELLGALPTSVREDRGSKVRPAQCGEPLPPRVHRGGLRRCRSEARH